MKIKLTLKERLKGEVDWPEADEIAGYIHEYQKKLNDIITYVQAQKQSLEAFKAGNFDDGLYFQVLSEEILREL